MDPARVRADIATLLADIAPEVDLGAVDPHEPLRQELDIDSMDFLKLLAGLESRTGVSVPEEAYGEVDTLDRLVSWVATRARG